MTPAPFIWYWQQRRMVITIIREVPTSDRPPPLPEEPFPLTRLSWRDSTLREMLALPKERK
jgi:hypothetical protein